ncbi:MAG: ABC transporter ATP-binding protein, partial [Lentisphaeria bacterium]|nr:ABC transporter ATP-binding protein [Lentisphaeria bacterium]
MLEVHDHFFRYQKKSPFLLSGLSFELKEGEQVMLLGANGTGKSTLLGLLNGRLQPDSGTVTLNGTDLSSLPARDRAKLIATVHQLPEELPGFTVAEMVMLGRTPYLSRLGNPSDTDSEAVREILDLLELTTLSARDMRQLSGGERQRVMLAAALVRKTPYLLLDGPTAAADPAHRI